MTRIFVIGAGPLLEEGGRFFSGQCLRTTHFTTPLRHAGHEIELWTHPISDRRFEPDTTPLVEEARAGDLSYRKLNSNDESLILPVLQEALEAFDPEAVLAVNPYPSHLACRLRTDRPIWCDLNGYQMVEGQMRARVYEDDGCLGHFLRQEQTCLRRADKFSTVSTPQKLALLGELAMMGRLNRWTFDYDFATVVPNAVAEHYRTLGAGDRRADDHFTVLWCGGFNTWTDVDMLFAGLTAAMERNDSIRFVATGGAIDGHDERTFVRFQSMVAESPYRDRFDLLGWVERDRVDERLMSCSLGINIDSKNYETLFGARNRLTTMLACGLPVLTTLGSEISLDLATDGLGFFVETGDAAGLAEALLRAASDREALAELGRRGRTWALERYEPRRTIQACLDWMVEPALAPDNAQRLLKDPDPTRAMSQKPLNSVEADWAALEAVGMEALMRDRRDLALIRRKPLFRWAKKIKSLLTGRKGTSP